MPLTLLDAALRGMLLALLALLALGQAVQTVAAMPWVETTLPLLRQAPPVAVSVANVVLFWIFVRAPFDDAFVNGYRLAEASGALADS